LSPWQEEIQRRRERAARFQTQDSLASYQPAVDPADIARRKKRAQRFGVDYQPEDAAGLMDVGELTEGSLTHVAHGCWAAALCECAWPSGRQHGVCNLACYRIAGVEAKGAGGDGLGRRFSDKRIRGVALKILCVVHADLLESKREVPAEVARRREAIHLYGVDLLNTKEVRLCNFRTGARWAVDITCWAVDRKAELWIEEIA